MNLVMTNRKRRLNLGFSNQEVEVYDFVRDRIACTTSFGHIIDQLNYTRASDTLMADANGIYYTFPANVAAQTNLGMKVSPAITNLIPNTGLQGAVVGEVTNDGVGRLPSGWGYQADWVDQVFVVFLGSENGLPTIDIRIVLTADGGSEYPYIHMGFTAVGVSGETHTASLYRKTIGDKPDVSTGSNVPLQVSESSSIDGSVSHSVIQMFDNETTELSRYIITYTLTKTGEIEQLIRSFYATVLDGESIDMTIRFAAPQIEIGSYAHDPVITEEAVTGVSDAVVVYDDISDLALGNSATVLVECDIPEQSDDFQYIVAFGTTYDDRAALYMSEQDLYIRHHVLGVYTSIKVVENISVGAHKLAFGYELNQLKFCLDGGAVFSLASADNQQVALEPIFNIGQNTYSLEPFNSNFQKIVIFDEWLDLKSQELTS
ncbi:MAG: hypothetical protein COB24_03670 [Hyphomicrobiales bacterium]|nr:MAG: hypothetical protein COB24_03670 [Hyphomicrobiales bacterium]